MSCTPPVNVVPWYNIDDPQRAQGFQPNPGWVVDNRADLKKLSRVGAGRAFLLGADTPADGGGGLFWLDTADISTIDDGFACLVAEDGGRWKRCITVDPTADTFRTNTLQAINPADPISFPVDPSFSGRKAWTRSGRNLYFDNKVVQTIRTLRSFGATGDGGTLDTTALQSALSSSERVLDGEGLTYLIDAELLRTSGLELRNATLKANTLAANTGLLKFQGTSGAPQTLAVDCLAGWACTVPDPDAFAVGGWVFLASDEYWSAASSDNVKYGELARVISKSGSVLTFAGTTLLNYTVAAAATITPLQMCSGIRLWDVNIEGPDSTGNQRGIIFDRCAGVTVYDCDSVQIDHTHFWLERSARVRVYGGSASKSGVQEGLDYGWAILYGCYDVQLRGFHGNGLRHVSTVGGSQGVSRHIVRDGLTGNDLTDAGNDSHTSVHEDVQTNCIFHFGDNADVTIDGIFTGATLPHIAGNHIYNCKRDGLRWAPEVLAAYTGPVAGTFSHNVADAPRNTGSNAGLMVIPTAVSGIREITAITTYGNQLGGFQNHTRIITAGAPIKKVSLSAGQSIRPCRSRGVYIQASDGDIEELEIAGGHYEVDNITSAAVIELIGAGSSYVRNWRLAGVGMKRNGAGTVGLKLTRCIDGTETASVWSGITVPYSVDAESTGMVFDLRGRGIYTHSVSAAYTAKVEDRSIIANRAAAFVLTLLNPAQYKGKAISVKTIQAYAMSSASANVVPADGTTAGTTILPAVAGAWAYLESDGVNWVILQHGS